MSRRRTLLKAGAAAAAVGVGALAWRAGDQGVFSTGGGPAYAPWDHWQDDPADSSRRLVAAAILAANPHNTQPWRFRVGDKGIDVFTDPARNIGSIDPFRREMQIGLGCALENLLLAGEMAGRQPRLALLPDTADPTHVGRLEFGTPRRPDLRRASLHAAIPLRHTNRGAYDPQRPLPDSAFAALDALRSDSPQLAVRWFRTPAECRTLGEQIVAATQAIVDDREQSRDSGAWFRNSWDEVQQHRDGLTIDAQAMPGWMRAAAKILPPVSVERADAMWLQTTREVHVASTSAFGLLLARDSSDTRQRLQGGMLWQRMHLWAQTQGIAMQPLNQMPERADRERSAKLPPRFQQVLADLVGDAGWQALMPFRLGHPTMTALRSPRRALDDVIVG